jgi:TonB-dependent SusC/RagA subfamily outer membrane receptor
MKTLITSLFVCLFMLQSGAQTQSVSGTVTDAEDVPLMGANISISGTTMGVQTDYNGKFSIEGMKGQELVFTYVGMKPFKMTISRTETVKIAMEEKAEALDPIVIGVYGVPKDQKRRPYAVTEISGRELENKPQADISRALVGKIPGAQITGVSGISGSGTNFVIRSMSSITGNNQPLFVVDGMPINTSTNTQGGFEGGITVVSSRIMDLDPNNIKKVKVLKGLSAAVLYGEQGRNGVILITTKTGDFSDEALAPDLPYSERILQEQERIRTGLANERTALEMGYKSPFQSSVVKIVNSNNKFETFLKELELHKSNPTFYIDVFNRFKKADPALANRMLEEFVKINSESRPLLKVLAFKLEEEGRNDLATQIYRRIYDKDPAHIGAARDLALSLHALGNQQEAIELISKALVQIQNNSDNASENSYMDVLKTELTNMLSSETIENYEAIEKTTADLRIVMDWNRTEIDLDMKVIDPNLDTTSFNNPKSSMGGQLLGNAGPGMGPETFQLQKIQTGSYYIKVGEGNGSTGEMGDDVYVKLTIFRNYGTPSETKEIQLIRIINTEETHLMDRIAVL